MAPSKLRGQRNAMMQINPQMQKREMRTLKHGFGFRFVLSIGYVQVYGAGMGSA